MEKQRVVWQDKTPAGSNSWGIKASSVRSISGKVQKPPGKWKEISAEIDAVGDHCERQNEYVKRKL